MLTAAFALLSAFAAALLTGAVMSRRMNRLKAELDVRIERQAATARDDLAALCAGAIGIDERFARLEQRTRRLGEQLNRLEANLERDRPYGEAIQLVHKGAGVPELMRKLDLTRNEAELIVSMHGVDEAV